MFTRERERKRRRWIGSVGEENVGVRVITYVGVIIAMTKKREIRGNRAQEMIREKVKKRWRTK